MEEQMARKKAQELIAEGDGEMKTFWMWRTKDNYYNAGKSYQNAAVQLKIAKDFAQAAEIYLKAAAIFAEKAEDKMQTTLCFNEAGVCYRQVDMAKAVECFTKAAHSYQQLNRWSPCAKLYDEIAQIYDQELFDRAAAIKAYVASGDAYKLANSPTSAHGAFLKAANLHAENEDFMDAIRLYENNAEYYAKQGGAMAHQVNNNAYRALICMMVHEVKKERLGDLGKTKTNYTAYCDRFPTFDGDDNAKLIDELIKAYEDTDAEQFQASLAKRRYKLDQWAIDRFIIVKRAMDGTLDVKGTIPRDDKPTSGPVQQTFNSAPVTSSEAVADDLL